MCSIINFLVNGWTVVQVRSLASLKEQMSLINVIFWIALILSIFFGVIFSIWQKRAVINPIVKLAKDVETIDEGITAFICIPEAGMRSAI